jgi:drug/metabolite transporter (DMT)-like permease
MHRRTLLVWGGLATIYLVWGSTYLAIRVMVETVPPLLGAGLRFVVAGAIFAAWLVARRGWQVLRVSPGSLLAAAGMGTLLMAGGNGLVTLAEQDAPSGLAGLIMAAIPLWVIVLRLLWRERVSGVTLAGVGLGFLGVGILIVPSDRPGGAPLWSVLVLLLAAASWASGSFLSGRVPLPEDVAVEGGELQLAELSGRSIVAFAYLIFFGSLLAFTAYAWLLQNVPISTVATYAFVNPVVAVLLGWAFLDEEVTTSMIVGAIAIVASVAFVVRQETTTPEGQAAPVPAAAAEALDAAEPH